MTSLNISKGSFLRRDVSLPPSKSYANRALILGALKGQLHIKNLPLASDVTSLVDGLKGLGVEIDHRGNELWIRSSFHQSEKEGEPIPVGEGGTTARFLACLAITGKRKHRFLLGERLRERPWEEFLTQVRDLGGSAELKGSVLEIQGPLNFPKVLPVDTRRTTQFASGFQLALSQTDVRVEPQNLTASPSYWIMTEHLIKELKTQKSYVVPVDWSSASYPLALAALTRECFFMGLRRDPFQADSKFLDLLKKHDLVQEETNGLRITPKKFSSNVQFDVRDCLDLVPTLAFFLAHIPGQHQLLGIENLRYKESDRLEEVIKLCRTFHRDCEVEGPVLKLTGHSKILPLAVNLQLPDDHRIVMAGALFLTFHSGGSISPWEAVQKSYPDFFQLFA